MARTYDKVIVFGPTGDVGGATAVEAHKRGAEVWLAMRDPSKPIPALGSSSSSSRYHRIKADLSNPQSAREAVQQSQAKAAFIYLVPTATDGLKATLQAVQEAGIEYVVFLSSGSITPDKTDLRRDIEPSDLIPWGHAQIELALEDLHITHTVLRPAQFAKNSFAFSLVKPPTEHSTQPWEAWVPFGDYRGDAIAPLDIGRVGGAVLVKQPHASSALKETIYLCGPNILTEDQRWDIIQRVTGRQVKIVRPSREEYTAFLAGRMPPPFAESLVAFQEAATRQPDLVYPEPFYSQSVANIQRYSGYEPTTFEQFVATYPL